jgi:DNA invertase Pin-like site-specific DNA recombinase
VAKLDRLARNLAFLDELQRSKLHFVALDCEHANKAMLQMMMVMAEWERDQVSARTKVALAERRKQGKALGAKNPACRNLTKAAMRTGRKLGAEANKVAADEAYADILPDMVAWRERGDTLAQIAKRLNDDGHTTRQGKEWTPGTVANVLRRAEVAA